MTEELPGETCAAIRFCGSHREAPLYYRKLDGFITGHGLKITGFSKEITMIDYGITNDTSQFVTELESLFRLKAIFYGIEFMLRKMICDVMIKM